ncbi:MarR family winged helix-turn-helix transcriptional regulator [Candidatus Desulfosporosinus nitrosoreducens]|uniref:MarR family winged helix-turn-helix transcriptional regulator n=1 Tax=Candidatus Desulfosporosinus nitrosoreducens TaxID=3401928 RepID=UPI00280A8784|nr:MarR family transcriptional regulator [Desulfosporosinus sp. PR]
MNTQDVISLISKIREKTNRFIVAEMSKYGIEGIVTSHGDIINALFKKPRLTMAEIAEKIGRDKSTVTALVDKLVRFGYVTKERDTEDTRVVYVTLTSKGSGLKPIFAAISSETLAVFYSDISEEEKEELVRILNKIYKSF